MPRIRSLKPEHRTHRKIGPLDHATYRLWVGMLLEADDEGRLVCDAEQLRVTIFGYHPSIRRTLVERSLATLEGVGLIRMYAVEGLRYAWFPSWHDHQKIDRKQPSKLPSCDDSSNDRRAFDERSSLIGSDLDLDLDRKGSDRSAVVMSDDQFVETLQTNPAYQGIDVKNELAKMDAWLMTPKARGRKKTRQFIVNWLNRVDKPVAGATSPFDARTAENIRAGQAVLERLKGQSRDDR